MEQLAATRQHLAALVRPALTQTMCDIWAALSLAIAAADQRPLEQVLEVEFSTGERFSYPAEYLRVHSPAAEARDRQGGPKVRCRGRLIVFRNILDRC